MDRGSILRIYGGYSNEKSGDINCFRGWKYGWFHRHGYPLALLSDQCPNVDGTLVRELCEKYAIQKLLSSATTRKETEELKVRLSPSNSACSVALKRKDFANGLA
ncbi:hypothetical protein LOD99_12466 [Oopsacas minuta]|uniref:Uncharacterized protein n=1 Tax=Oopsacas minuta TaxID=111878 RepID=A0AAV7JFE8_9METZ|nr:hypothetical protein LOD99_12466 [Oopsacas minuta]